MNIEGTAQLAEAIWKARFGNRDVDNETSVQIWLCAELFLYQHEDGLYYDEYFEQTAKMLASETPYTGTEFGHDNRTLGITHQDIADKAWSLWAGNEDASHFEHLSPEEREAERLYCWYTAESILQRGERE